MNTLQIDKILKMDPRTKSVFRGVYPVDMMPKVLEYPSSFVFNCSESQQQGSHWVAIYLPAYGVEGEFFDSYGNSPNYYDPRFGEFILQNANGYNFNSTDLQGLFSDVCGQYVIMYLYYRSRNISMLDFVAKFSKSTSKNDSNARSFVAKHFGSINPPTIQSREIVHKSLVRYKGTLV